MCSVLCQLFLGSVHDMIHTNILYKYGSLCSGDTATKGHFLKTVSYLPHVKEPVTKGHLSCRDTLSDIEVSLEDRFYCIFHQL